MDICHQQEPELADTTKQAPENADAICSTKLERRRNVSEPLLSVKNMKKTFQANGGMFSKKKFVHAVNDVSFDIYPGETFSLVGESGCGKSTTGKLIDHLITPDSGEIWFEGKEISRLSEKEMRPLRSDIQMVFQDPYGSLNPRMKVQDLIGEPLLIHTNMSAGERLKKVHDFSAL